MRSLGFAPLVSSSSSAALPRQFPGAPALAGLGGQIHGRRGSGAHGVSPLFQRYLRWRRVAQRDKSADTRGSIPWPLSL